MTIVLGFWLIPLIISVLILVQAAIYDQPGFMQGFGYILASVPILLVWVIYLLSHIFLGII